MKKEIRWPTVQVFQKGTVIELEAWVRKGSVLGRVWGGEDPTPGVSVTCRRKEGWRLRNLEVCTENGKRGG